VSVERREVIAGKVFSAYINAMIKLIEKLDLGTKEKNDLSEENPIEVMLFNPSIHLELILLIFSRTILMQGKC